MAEPTVTIAEAAEMTGLSKKAISRRVDRGQLRVFMEGGLRRIPVSELDRLGLLDVERPAAEPTARVDRLLRELDRLVLELHVAVAEERDSR